MPVIRSTLEDRFKLMSLEDNEKQETFPNDDYREQQASLVPFVETDPLIYRLPALTLKHFQRKIPEIYTNPGYAGILYTDTRTDR